jgi:hypothetical protein
MLCKIKKVVQSVVYRQNTPSAIGTECFQRVDEGTTNQVGRLLALVLAGCLETSPWVYLRWQVAPLGGWVVAVLIDWGLGAAIDNRLELGIYGLISGLTLHWLLHRSRIELLQAQVEVEWHAESQGQQLAEEQAASANGLATPAASQQPSEEATPEQGGLVAASVGIRAMERAR